MKKITITRLYRKTKIIQVNVIYDEKETNLSYKYILGFEI